jgi:sugar lactone lactonase YvrE
MSALRSWAFGAQLGEGPVWHEAQRRLYFVDIYGPAIHAKYFSYIVIKSPFVKTHCPIERLFPERAA